MIYYSNSSSFRRKQGILAKYQNQWNYIYVDEYQDTNKVQYQIAKLLSDKQQIFV